MPSANIATMRTPRLDTSTTLADLAAKAPIIEDSGEVKGDQMLGPELEDVNTDRVPSLDGWGDQIETRETIIIPDDYVANILDHLVDHKRAMDASIALRAISSMTLLTLRQIDRYNLAEVSQQNVDPFLLHAKAQGDLDEETLRMIEVKDGINQRNIAIHEILKEAEYTLGGGLVIHEQSPWVQIRSLQESFRTRRNWSAHAYCRGSSYVPEHSYYAGIVGDYQKHVRIINIVLAAVDEALQQENRWSLPPEIKPVIWLYHCDKAEDEATDEQNQDSEASSSSGSESLNGQVQEPEDDVSRIDGANVESEKDRANDGSDKTASATKGRPSLLRGILVSLKVRRSHNANYSDLEAQAVQSTTDKGLKASSIRNTESSISRRLFGIMYYRFEGIRKMSDEIYYGIEAQYHEYQTHLAAIYTPESETPASDDDGQD